MAERLPAADVPASTGVRRAGVNDDEAVLLREGLVWTAIVVCLGGSRAIVYGYDDTRRDSELFRHIDVEGCSGGSRTKRSHLREGTGRWGTFVECCRSGY
jgi:hypothetical protein